MQPGGKALYSRGTLVAAAGLLLASAMLLLLEGRPGFVISPWCGDAKCEADIKAETQATIRNIPKGYDEAPGAPCIKCNKPATVSAWFAKAY